MEAILTGRLLCAHRGIPRAEIGQVRWKLCDFAPALVESVGDAVDVLSAAGYLSPTGGNSYTYAAVSTDDQYVVYRKPFVAGEDKD